MTTTMTAVATADRAETYSSDSDCQSVTMTTSATKPAVATADSTETAVSSVRVSDHDDHSSNSRQLRNGQQ